MPPKMATPNATKPSVAASLSVSNASDPMFHAASATIGSTTNAITPHNNVRSAPFRSTDCGRCP